MSHPLFILDAGLNASLQQQLRQQIAKAILDLHIPLDSPLPSSRKLAKQLNVARNTVVLAYEHLLDDGYLIARERSGYFVNPNILDHSVQLESTSDERLTSGTKPDWQGRFKLHPTKQENITKPNDWQNFQYPFIYGQFDPDLFPTNHWRECCRDNVSVPAIRSWAADHFVADDPMLIEQIHTRVLPRRGVWANPEEILITIGCQQGLYMLAQLLLDKNTTMGLEDPGFVDMRNIASLNPSKLKALPVDEGGLIVDEGLAECDCVFVTPSHHYPTTVTMPLDRRRKLLEMASQEDFLIIEQHLEHFKTLAFDLESFGHNCFQLRGIPNDMSVSDAESSIKDMVLQIKNDPQTNNSTIDTIAKAYASGTATVTNTDTNTSNTATGTITAGQLSGTVTHAFGINTIVQTIDSSGNTVYCDISRTATTSVATITAAQATDITILVQKIG